MMHGEQEGERSIIRAEPTSDQVKGLSVLRVRSHLTGQEVQLGWGAIDLQRDADE